MSPSPGPVVDALVQAWATHRGVVGPLDDATGEPGPPDVVVRRVDVLRPGRPGLLDIVAEVDGRVAHLVAGLRGVTDEPHFLRGGEEAVLGLIEDDEGLAVAVDALADAQLAPLLLAIIRQVDPRPGPVTTVRDDDDAVVLDCGDRGDLVVFPWLSEAPRPEVDLLVGLDAAGFNHVAAPLVRWKWGDIDLGLVQEPLADRSSGWALALTSLRDLYASGGQPEAAGGDFGPEAAALGTMTARMHLASDRTFNRHPEPVQAWVEMAVGEIEAADATLLKEPGVADLLDQLSYVESSLPVIRTHGDFHLGRIARTDQGWVVSDTSPGGVVSGVLAIDDLTPTERCPLADVADLLWSFHQASLAAATERDPTGRLDLSALGQAWETRNRRALMTAYMGTPGILGLTGADREVVRNLIALFELARSVRPT
jgi:maltokinase